MPGDLVTFEYKSKIAEEKKNMPIVVKYKEQAQNKSYVETFDLHIYISNLSFMCWYKAYSF